MRKISAILLLIILISSCGKKYTVRIGMAYENEPPLSYANKYKTIPYDFTIRAKNDSLAYYKSVIIYLKMKNELEMRKSDTFLIGLREGDYIKGLSNYYEESGDRTSLDINSKLNIENIITTLIKENKLDLTK